VDGLPADLSTRKKAYLKTTGYGQNAVLVSCDTDFARFKRLRWKNSLQS
jgi:phosphopantetheinyl transferase